MLPAEDRTSIDRVRHSTAPEVNREIDRRTNNNIRHYANSSEEVIHRRIEELDQEWDIERALEVNASTLALSGLLLGVYRQPEMVGVTGGSCCHSCCNTDCRDGARLYPYYARWVYGREVKSTGKNMS